MHALPPFSAEDMRRDRYQYHRRRQSKLFNAHWDAIVAHYGGLCLRCNAAPADTVARVGVVYPPHRRTEKLTHVQPMCRACHYAAILYAAQTTLRSDSQADAVVVMVPDFRPDSGKWVMESFPGHNNLF